jgi:hypothetical protein
MAGSIDTADHNSFPFAEFNYTIQLIQINEFPITALSFNLPLSLYSYVIHFYEYYRMGERYLLKHFRVSDILYLISVALSLKI